MPDVWKIYLHANKVLDIFRNDIRGIGIWHFVSHEWSLLLSAWRGRLHHKSLPRKCISLYKFNHQSRMNLDSIFSLYSSYNFCDLEKNDIYTVFYDMNPQNTKQFICKCVSIHCYLFPTAQDDSNFHCSLYHVLLVSYQICLLKDCRYFVVCHIGPLNLNTNEIISLTFISILTLLWSIFPNNETVLLSITSVRFQSKNNHDFLFQLQFALKCEWLFVLSVSHGNIILFRIVLYRLSQQSLLIILRNCLF